MDNIKDQGKDKGKGKGINKEKKYAASASGSASGSDSGSESDSQTENTNKTNPIQGPFDPVKFFNTKEFYYYKMIDKFFRTCSMDNKLLMISIIDGSSDISLRVLDWVVTRYSKKYITIENNVYGLFDIHISYKSQLKTFKKRYFDPFKRRLKFYYSYDPSDDTKKCFTTLGQLNFFRWAFTYNIVDYVKDNLADILKAMNNSNKDDKKKKVKKKETEKIKELKIKQQEVIAKTMNNIIVVNEVVQDLNKDQKPKSESQPNIPKKATSITQSTSFHVGDSIIVSFD